MSTAATTSESIHEDRPATWNAFAIGMRRVLDVLLPGLETRMVANSQKIRDSLRLQSLASRTTGLVASVSEDRPSLSELDDSHANQYYGNINSARGVKALIEFWRQSGHPPYQKIFMDYIRMPDVYLEKIASNFLVHFPKLALEAGMLDREDLVIYVPSQRCFRNRLIYHKDMYPEMQEFHQLFQATYCSDPSENDLWAATTPVNSHPSMGDVPNEFWLSYPSMTNFPPFLKITLRPAPLPSASSSSSRKRKHSS